MSRGQPSSASRLTRSVARRPSPSSPTWSSATPSRSARWLSGGYSPACGPARPLACAGRRLTWRAGMCRSARRSCGGAEKAKSKTSVARDVILNSPAAGAMQRQRKRSQIAGQHGRLDPRYSIPWREERALRRSYWEPCLKRLGIRYRPPNNMRHSYATMMCDPVAIARARHAALKPVSREMQAYSAAPKPLRTRSAIRTAMLRAGSNGRSSNPKAA